MMTIKKCFLYLITPWLLCSYAQAAATLSIGDFTGSPGATATEVLIKFQNDEAVALLAFDLKYKAAGANVFLDGAVDFAASTGSVLVNSGSVAPGATVNVVVKDSETLTFIINNFAGAAINPSATAQTLFTVKLQVGIGADIESTPLDLLLDRVIATNFQPVNTTVVDGTFTVVKFNAPALAGVVNEGAGQIVLTPVFTDENGAAKDGVIRQVNFAYPDGENAATLGAFAVSGDQKSILYTAPTMVGNIAPFDFVATYTASSGANVDQNTVTVTVTPVNDPPAVAIVGPVAAINEGQPVSFAITVDDEEESAFDFVVYRQDGAQWKVVEGTWAGLTFTSTETPDNDVVVHPNPTKVVNLKVEAVDQVDAQTTESAPAPVTIHDVDQLVSAPTAATIVPDPAYVTDELDVTFTPAVDPDQEDVVTYTYLWTNNQNATQVTTKTVPAGTAKKGETWTVVVTANSFNGDNEDSAPAQITISNSPPAGYYGELFIQKDDDLPKFKDIDLGALARDPDGDNDISNIEIVTQPTKGTLTHKAGTVYTYKVTGDDAFFWGNADTFSFKAEDADGAESDIVRVWVTYRAPPFCRRAASGILNGQLIDQQGDTVLVSPGQIIQGSIKVQVNNMLDEEEERASLVTTVNWGDRRTQYVIALTNLPDGESFLTFPLTYVAPDVPGDYYVLVGYARTNAVPHFLSSTHAERAAQWNDGNDLGFDWTDGQFAQALSNEGRVMVNILQLNDQYSQELAPVTAVRIRVQSEWNVTFMAEGGDTPVPESKSVTVETPYGLLATSNRVGYTFMGWWTAPDGGSEVTPETIVTADTDHALYARWTVNQYSIAFDAAGGTAVAPITADFGAPVTAPADPTRDGYSFTGWDPVVPATMPALDQTLTAQWTINRYTIAFDAAGGTAVAPITADFGAPVTAPADPTRDGYTFAGWTPLIPKTMPAVNQTLTASWAIMQYAVTFDLGEHGNRTGGGELQQLVDHNGSALTPIFTIDEGWEFIGWDADFTQVVGPQNIRAQYRARPGEYDFAFSLEASWNSGVAYALWMLGGPDASDGYYASEDKTTDLPLPPLPSPNQEEAFFQLPGDNVKLLWDAHSLDDTVDALTWTLQVAVPVGKPATLSWDNWKIPADWRLTITSDNPQIYVDMDDESSLFIEQSGCFTFTITAIRATLCGTVTYELNAGWNLIGVPLELTPPAEAYLLEQNLLCVDSLNSSYELVTNVIPGKAYWLFCEEATRFALDGLIIQDNTMTLVQGWNFVGPTVDMTKPVDEVVVWEWTPEGYRLPEVVNGQYQLWAKKGYWILAP